MSKRRVLGTSTNNNGKLPETSISTEPQAIVCPICNISINSIQELNNHVDKVHLQIPAPTTSQPKPKAQKDTKSKELHIIPTNHFIKIINNSRCTFPSCNYKINSKNPLTNCSKCGKIYCSKHNNIKFKLDQNLKILNEHSSSGIWCNCCLSCLEEFETTNQLNEPKVIDKTNDFKLIRNLKNKDNELERLLLEKRFDKINQYIINEFNKHDKLNDLNFKNFENNLVNWNTNNINNCSICNVRFTFFNRKHHCRTCGNVVCNDLKTGCSMIVPLEIIFKLMNSDNEKEIDNFENIVHALKQDLFDIRICLNCKKSVLNKKIFNVDKGELNNHEFLKIYKLWILILNNFDTKNMSIIKNDNDMLNFVNLIQRLDKLINNIDYILENDNTLLNDEFKILKTLKLNIVNYIQLKLPILRKAQDEKLQREQKILTNIINNKPKFNQREIREKREKLMVLNEQKFLVNNMYQEFKKQRRFDDLKTLDMNLIDIEREIDQLNQELGDESFTT